MDDKTKDAIVAGAIANLPLIVATVQQLMNMAVNLAESVNMTPEQVDIAWAEARADGMMRRARDLPDADI
jgi:hypothetical protein